MCIHPVTINRENPKFPFDKLSGVKFLGTDNSVYHGYYRLQNTVPCGKCIECLKRRQNDLATRCMREASKRGSMCFLTLTYDNEHIPLQVRLVRADKDTGEVLSYSSSTPLVRCKDPKKSGDPAYLELCRGLLDSMHLSPCARVLTMPFVEFEDSVYQYEITPSLYRRDVRLWLKRSRVRYKRQFGADLPDFSYVVCGEYGPRTCRPHYHIAFFGLPLKDVQFLRDQWEYGFSNLKQVNAVNEDGSNGFEIASRYIGKYMSKGKFECDAVKCGLAEKPRLMLSVGVGTDLDDKLIRYFRCYDLYGCYDITSKELPFTEKQREALFYEIRKRAFFTFGRVKYAIPLCISKKLWYNKIKVLKNGKDTTVLRASEFRLSYADFVQSHFFSDSVGKLKERCAELPPGEASSLVSEFVASSENSELCQERFNERDLSAFYARSIF